MGSPKENSISDGETTQITCIPLIGDCSPLTRRAKEISSLWVFLKYFNQWSLCGIENQGADVSERDFYRPPIRALVEAFGLCAGGVPFPDPFSLGTEKKNMGLSGG
jgi:hypothetical protein